MGEHFQMEIGYPDKPLRSFDVTTGVYTIGSDDNNKIVLPGGGVSWRHAVLTLMPDECYIEDLDSRSGIRVNRKRVRNRERVFPGQEIEIGEYNLCFKHEDDMQTPEESQSEPEETEPPKASETQSERFARD